MARGRPKSAWKQAQASLDKVEMTAKQLIPQEVEKPTTEYAYESEKFDLNTRKTNPLDPLTIALQSSGYCFNQRFAWLSFDFCGMKYPLAIDRFYQEYNLAVDLDKKGHDLELTEIKKKLCKQNGVNYFHISSSDEAERMVQEVLHSAKGVQ